ncbi:glycosyltransferase [Mangrovivirga sp. M17]|uniref:Glycosyltransferase n=1 Tax=Mangrovivirga halotolerans TaxID=2993936 RepID=A0ABT3RV22_9BACT|nr:glycosyltransferase [Mangrovivirga halotolerans]MCX2745198.1 glycosyltransferase [Mangrovivirga halotolerans]
MDKIKYKAFLVTFNRSDRLSNVIESILNQTIKPSILYIINNGSTDNTDEVLNQYRNFDNLKILNTGNNIGHGAALAYGFKYYLSDSFIDSDNLMLFEDDSVPSPELSEYVIKNFYKYSSDFLCLDGFSIKLGKRTKPDFSNSKLVELDFGLFDGCIFKAEIIKKVGTPVEDWFMMYDDIEYCQRIRKAGYKIHCIENIYHEIDHSGAMGQTSSLWRGYYQTRNHVHYLKLHANSFEVFDFLVIESKRIIGTLLKGNLKKFKYRIIGLLDGILGVKGKSLNPATFKFER